MQSPHSEMLVSMVTVPEKGLMSTEHHHMAGRFGDKQVSKKEHSPPWVDTDAEPYGSHIAYVCATADLRAEGIQLAPRKSMELAWWKRVKATAAKVHRGTTFSPLTHCSSLYPWANTSTPWRTGHNYKLACLRLLVLKGTFMFSLCLLLLVFLSSNSA